MQLIHMDKCFKDKEVLTNINLVVEQGDFVLIHGKSGSGKSTLLNILGGLEKQTGGRLLVDEKEIISDKQRAQLRRNVVGFVFQDYGLIDNETVKENLMILSPIRKITNKDLECALEKVGLNPELLGQKVYELSGGEQQRVSIARALLKRAPVLLADEPAGNLDRENAEKIFHILRDLNRQGVTIICVSHDTEVYEYFNKRFLIKEKQIWEG